MGEQSAGVMVVACAVRVGTVLERRRFDTVSDGVVTQRRAHHPMPSADAPGHECLPDG